MANLPLTNRIYVDGQYLTLDEISKASDLSCYLLNKKVNMKLGDASTHNYNVIDVLAEFIVVEDETRTYLINKSFINTIKIMVEP